MTEAGEWLSIKRGDEPLIVSLPHTGIFVPEHLAGKFASPWLTTKDTDWYIDRVYGFAAKLGATVIHTSVSRSVIDVNRDPSGVSLYPGQATTDLCPTSTFDGEKLYRAGADPDEAEIKHRREAWFDPYHRAISFEIDRLRSRHPHVVLYDCHSIRSKIPRLFEGQLSVFNIGTNGGTSAHPILMQRISDLCAHTGESHVANGRFRGGYITRNYGDPAKGVHSVQMELACRAYLSEPDGAATEANWPATYDPHFSPTLSKTLSTILKSCISFAKTRSIIEALK